MRFIESLLLNLAISALFFFAGWLIGRIFKRPFAITALLAFLCSIPTVLILGAFRSNPLLSAQRGTILQFLAMWDGLTTLLVLAGYVLSRRRRVGMAVACTLILLQLTYVSTRWLDQTHWLDAGRWHQYNGDRVRVGSWEFVIPEAWYQPPLSEAVVGLWRSSGVSEMLYLERRSLSITRDRPSIEIFMPASAMASSPEEVQGMMPDSHFQIHGEYGMCSLAMHRQKELRFTERCKFPNADLGVWIEGRTQEDLHEAGRILSEGQFVKTSNPIARVN